MPIFRRANPMSKILIRRYQDSDCGDVLNICYRTGYMGNDFEGTRKFDDSKLFGYFFCLHYLLYEKEHCFVAIDEDRDYKLVGYIIGTLDTKKQQTLFLRKMLFKISGRLVYAFFKYPETFRSVMNMLKNRSWRLIPRSFYSNYPVHFHINILAEYQHKGIGSSLIAKFEDHIKKNGSMGIHLKTSNKNYSAIQFYYKNGYRKLFEFNDTLWKGVEDYKTIILIKNCSLE
jgi:ribosomal protein S18 acetylase RimI-like enzyme